MDWHTYVRRTAGEHTRQLEIAERTGIDQATVSRWLRGEHRSLTPPMVTRFARAFNRPVLEAFVYAGLLTEGDARVRVIRPPSLDAFSLDELLQEITQRTKQGQDVS